ncbi:MAG: PfaD family polyunsaturated fatty acid/polyketide biosynthesis protein [Eubacteriaceae bacterium]|jgi:PfaD family protein|nr:PfaD family polyunsaturated fatty acid/polyketide biosynthesis protein [Eubacteriaceae bacterium]
MANSKFILRGGSLVGPADAQILANAGNEAYIVDAGGALCAAVGGESGLASTMDGYSLYYTLPIPKAETLGDPAFRADYKTKYAYMGGSMAYGISSVEMVIALAKAGCLGSYGTGGLSLETVSEGIDRIQAEVGDRPYCVNMLNNITDPIAELNLAKLLVEKNVGAVEASAYINLTKALLYYRVSGLRQGPGGEIERTHKIIAKVSHEEVAMAFMQPPEPSIVESMLKEGAITEEQARLATLVPVADDITMEADSGGHTDNRPLVSILPAAIAIRDFVMAKQRYQTRIRIGAAGGIATPQSIVAAFDMGASYVVAGSVHQSCVEAGTSDYVKELLSTVAMGDVIMTIGPDAFEMGVKVQALRKNTMEPMNGLTLYQTYTMYNSFDEVPEKLRKRIINNFFKMSVEDVWKECEDYYKKNNPMRLQAAAVLGKVKMALMFRWYIGLAVKWAIEGNEDRKMDMMIMCGPSMGAFNNWVIGTIFEKPENRRVAQIAEALLDGAAVLKFARMAEACGVNPDYLPKYQITPAI